ncbi:zinc finger protein 831 isoform X2 [Hemicordylus capensis]|uniref:zinc finger protein 831 isoform X2 n=1 Tax=Hemicordylus capensis TaxID=884348 RepID=UPI002304B02D|nr:zinc finger protein 831 isoform X2 [Hemicordylus capensis]
MEAQRLPGLPVSLGDQPVQISCLQAVPAASNLSLSPVILQPEQALSQTIYLKALTIPLYQPLQSECPRPSGQLPMGRTHISLESSHMPLILSPFLHSEGTDKPHTFPQKHPQTINIVSGLPVLPQSSPYTPLGSPGKSKSAGKYLCKHCGRDCLKPSVLEKHMRSHTGERPFPCSTCGIAFKTQSNLYKHRRTQTHVNNAKLPSESDSSSPLEENEKVTERAGSQLVTKDKDRNGDHTRAAIKQAVSESTGVLASEKRPHEVPFSPANALSRVTESQWATTDSSYNGGVNPSVLEKEAMKDPGNPLQRRKIQEQRSPTVGRHSQLQRQQATYSDKLWDSRSPDYKLKKCESTDSGYLSRSDSVEQQMLSPSPLHSLCEHSTEFEGETAISHLRCAAGYSSKVDLTEKATLEKKKLEEHISKLISQNKAVVDDRQLDNVRPRKTVLSKQGSIDLPMPYTYKDSFHFDIRSLDIHRKKNLPLCSAKSTFTPAEKSKPLFFHSVPTQFSTTTDCVPVTRSNSLPFVESSRRMQDQVDSSKLSSFTRMPPSTSCSALLHSNKFPASTADFPNSHPRALVRQVAVDDLLLSNLTESSCSAEEMKGSKRPGARGEGAKTKGKKPSQRKLKMFSQEKWQVYGDETFKKIYQKMKSNQTTKKQKGNKVTEMSVLHSDAKETASNEDIAVPRNDRSSTTRNLVSTTRNFPASVGISTKLESEGHSISSLISQSVSSQESSSSFAERMETSYSVTDGAHSRMMDTRHGLSQEPHGNHQELPLSTGCELRSQLGQTKSQENRTPLSTASLQRFDHGFEEEKCVQGELIKFAPLAEDIALSKGEDAGGKESSQLAQVTSPLYHCNISKLVQESQKLPSERKKLKVDELKSKENEVLKAGPSSSAERIVKLLDHCNIINIVSPVSKNHSITREKQTLMAGMNAPVKGEKQKVVAGGNASASSMECIDADQQPTVTSSHRDYIANLTNTANVSAFSFSEQIRAEVKKEYICSSYMLQKLTEQPSSSITGTRMSSSSGNMTPTSSIVTPHPRKNEFLPKYILKHSQERNSTGMPLVITGEQEKIPLPSTLTDTTYPASNNRLLGTHSADLFLCPLQLGLTHPTRAKELKWDVCSTWKSLVACSPAILETTSITTRVDRRCPHQSTGPKEKAKHDPCKGTDHLHSLGDPKRAQEEQTTVCSSHTPAGKKICFTSMYTGGFLISSDRTGPSSALQLIRSGTSSIISVSSLVERTALCGNTDQETKEWESDGNSLPRLQDLPICSVDNPKCLCHASDMLYCHMLCTQQKDVRTLSQFSSASRAGNSKTPSLSISFPALNAEPQLTWCCLTRNLPLPVEQKEKKDSAYFPLHSWKSENVVSKCSLSFSKMKNTRRTDGEGMTTGTSKIPISQQEQIEKYFSTSRSDGLLEDISDQDKAKEKLCKTRELTTHKAKKSRKRKKVKINPKRYKGSYGYRHILLKSNRLSKQHWPTHRALEMPKKCHSHPHTPDSLEFCQKCLCLPTASQGNDPNLQQETTGTTTDKAASPEKKNHMEDVMNNSGITCSSLGSLSSFWQKDKVNGQGVSKPANEHPSGSLFLQRTANTPDITYSCALVTNAPTQKASRLDLHSLGIIQKETQTHVHIGHSWPSIGTCNFEFIDTGKVHPCHNVGSEVTSPLSTELKRGSKNVLCVESKCQNAAVSEPSVYTTGRKEQPTDGDVCPSLKEQFSSTFQAPRPVLLGSKLLTETSVSSSSRHVRKTSSSPACLECADKNSSSTHLGGRQEETLCKAGLLGFKNLSAPLASSGIPTQAYKKQSLEMTNKQNRVEYDDTSSDDEDRLIIEI